MSDTTDVADTVNTAGDAGSSTSTNNTESKAKTTTSNEGTAQLENLLQGFTAKFSEFEKKLAEVQTAKEEKRDDSQGDGVKYTEADMQKRINAAVRQRLTEKDEQYKERLNEFRQQVLAEATAEFEKQKQNAIAEAIAARDFEIAKGSLQKELGLTDAQVSRLQGKTVEELRADANLLGFIKTEEKEKKEAPNIKTGTSAITGVSDPSDIAALVSEGLRM